MGLVRIIGIVAMLLGIGIVLYAVFGSMIISGFGNSAVGVVSIPKAFVGLMLFIIGVVATIMGGHRKK